MMVSTPVKIIAVILIPLLIAGIIRFSNVQNKGTGSGAKAKDEEKKSDNESKDLKIAFEWLLPKELNEISGISWLDADRFVCVQDEAGKIFIYNTRSASIEKEIPFAGKGDYEGVALVGETVYVLDANGTIFEINNYSKPGRTVKLYETHLKKRHDSESLAYDKANNRLLVAIKAEESDNADFKGIYAFNLNSKRMDTKPVYKINLNDKVFEGEKSKKKLIQPSDIEIHPLTGDIYIIQGDKPRVLIMNSDGDIRSLYNLRGKEFTQPEGISFSPEGLMYISNEGDPGNILQVELNTESNRMPDK